MESFGWLISAGLALLLVAREETLVRVRKKLADRLMTAVEKRFASSRWVRARAIARYRRTIAENFSRVPVPFSLPVALPMDEVYIPLRAGATNGADDASPTFDLAAAVGDSIHTVVLGAPGSGKSLFLRYLLWSACAPPPAEASASRSRGRLSPAPEQPLAVLVPLTRLATSGDVEAEIADAFARDGFAGAAPFVEREVRREDTDLLVLFDGLDEVGSDQRATVTQLLTDFAERHTGVQFVVTCRTQVYGGALDGVAERVLHVEPFSDELVERFLRAWPLMRKEDSADRLITTLRDTPRVAILASNPLLLTMLAYLYTTEYNESTSMLPRNRTQFYRDSTELLLRRWKEEHQKQQLFPWQSKKVVLQHLALNNHRLASGDRRGVGYEQTLRWIEEVLPRVSLLPSQAQAVLDNIVERSGLLVKLDGGERYQFAHLSMQEYFAAIELVDDPQTLIKCYESDPPGWREPVKLWCGGEQDSTTVIQAIERFDPVLALECLADATRVDDGYAVTLVERVRPALFEPFPDDAVVQAFGILAAAPTERGQAVLNDLIETARRPGGTGVFEALAASNLPEAARFLAEHTTHENTTQFLERMGNVAIPALGDTAASRDTPEVTALRAVRSLTVIGTPQAAVALMLLMGADSTVSMHAAIGLAQLTETPAVEDALAANPAGYVAFSEPLGAGWIWEPFFPERPMHERRTLQAVFARCSQLLQFVWIHGNNTRVERRELIAGRPIDTRLALGVALLTGSRPMIPDEAEPSLRMAAFERADVARFPYKLRPEVEAALSEAPASAWPTEREWRRMGSDSPPFILDGSWYHRFPLLVVFGIAGAAFIAAWPHLGDTTGWGQALMIAMLVALTTPAWIAIDQSVVYLSLDPWGDTADAVGLTVGSPVLALEDVADGIMDRVPFQFLGGLVMIGFTPALGYATIRWLVPDEPFLTAVALGAFVVLTVGVYLLGVRKRRRSAVNPDAVRLLRQVFGSGTEDSRGARSDVTFAGFLDGEP